MKKLCITVLMSIIATTAGAIEICGPNIADHGSIEFTEVKPLVSGLYIGFWGVGNSCAGGNTPVDVTGDDGNVSGTKVAAMCESDTDVVVKGQAICLADYWNIQTTAEFDERQYSKEDKKGQYCWCRRTNMKNKEGVLADSVGLWVLIGALGSFESCQTACAQRCAQTVAYDIRSEKGNSEQSAGSSIMVLSVY